MVEPEDNLGIANNPALKNNLGEEQIYFSDKMQKKTVEGLFSKTQERIFVVTDLAIYNIKVNEIKRRIKIEDLKGITVSKTSNQFIIHCNQNEYDYLYIYPKRKKIVKMLQSVYENKTSKDLLFCQKNDKDLSKFVVTKKERTKSPYLSKIEQNELTSIKDYIENDNVPEEPEPPQQSQKASPPPPEPSGPVKVVASKGKGVPPPPPPPPPPPKVATVPSSKPTSSKPVDLAAELAAKKNNLSHVEVKDYVSPALQKPEEGGVPQTGNSMMAAIMAKRNQMKKVGGAGAGGAKPPVKPVPRASAPSVAPPKPVPRPSAPAIPSVHATKNPTTGNPKFPATTAPKPAAPKPTTNTGAKPTTNTGAKPPMKMGGGGGGGFAAKMAALQARMAGPSGGGGGASSSSTPASTAPSKPIVELCEGNTKRMDINKVIGNLEKEKKKQASKSSSKPVEVKVVSGKGKGIPPPPPPPPPPPKIK